MSWGRLFKIWGPFPLSRFPLVLFVVTDLGQRFPPCDTVVSDVFSFSCLLWHHCFRRFPFVLLVMTLLFQSFSPCLIFFVASLFQTFSPCPVCCDRFVSDVSPLSCLLWHRCLRGFPLALFVVTSLFQTFSPCNDICLVCCDFSKVFPLSCLL